MRAMRFLQRVRAHSGSINCDGFQTSSQLLHYQSQPRINKRFRENDIARSCRGENQRGQCRLRTRTRDNAFGVDAPQDRCQPSSACRAVCLAPAAHVISHEQVDVASYQHLRRSFPDQRLEVQAGWRRRDVHAQVHPRRQINLWRCDERAKRATRGNQLTTAGFGQTSGYGRKVNVQKICQLTL